MNLRDESPLAERRLAFERMLPRRVDMIGRRLDRFLQTGWDINGLSLMQEDTLWLGKQCQDVGLDALVEPLQALANMVDSGLAGETLPDPTLGERMLNEFEALAAATPRHADPGTESPTLRPVGNTSRAETPPPSYWRRWGNDAGPRLFVDEAPAPVVAKPKPVTLAEEYLEWNSAFPPDPGPTEFVIGFDKEIQPAPSGLIEASVPVGQSAPTQPVPEKKREMLTLGESSPTSAPANNNPATARTPARMEPARKLLGAGFRLYHLTSHNPVSLELDQRLETMQVEVDLLEDADELEELLGALPADLVLVDAEFADQLERIGQAVRGTRQRGHKSMQLVAIAHADDIALRLSARRAGVDTLISGVTDANEVLKRLQAAVDPAREAAYRVLIVEDDRSQALFAEGILRNAGMDSLVVLDALGVLPALEQFHPDLILMDLNMPDANGIELTALIREQDAFMQTPIVFLSGESDEDRQFDAIDAGGDDFLAKPIRPRHLISAVQNRVRRHRALEERRSQRPLRDTSTGLHDRASVLELIAPRLGGNGDARPGGLLFVEIESVTLLRERLGLTALEEVLAEAGRLVNGLVGELPAARFGDGSFVVLAPDMDDTGMESLAVRLRAALMQHGFQAQGHPLRLRASVGISPLRFGFPDIGALLNAVEKATREARTQDRGVRRYEPPKPVEAQREAALLAQLRDAVQGEHLELLYQPVVAVAGSDDSQFQVLLRMRDNQGRLRSAAEIIPIAEQADFIVEIDRWVISQALTLIRDRRAEGRELRLFVTQSPLTLADSSQTEWLRGELVSHAVPGTSLVIELRLEDAAIHAGTIRQFCLAMVADGVQFCLSQFEPGPDSDALLEQLPLGFIKLARKYTAGNLSTALRDELRILIDRSHRRGLEVIGHGVEDAQAAATLWMSGIDFIQGNLVQQANQELDFDFNQAVL
ncbi:EAL domain-containing protein [Arenimonas sp.]|uniref:EAL domain-containing protein n=1 Tax=Arenimonas sp. TaxID=1872635 RepID=UPI0039E725FC